MENKLPTAEELLANNIDGLKEFINDDDIFYFYKSVICEFAKSFAELHVEALRKEILKEIALIGNCYWEGIIKTEEKFKLTNDVYIDKNSILNAYNLDEIK